jgi:RNA polymerase sigma factor (sigma-70 family)
MSHDTEMLRRYVEEGSESAFADLVREHLNLVYSAALRETGGDGALAEDISQAVFTELARKGARLLSHPSLAGWLYTTVRHVAANTRRTEQRRRWREEKVMTEMLSEDSPEEAWRQLRPALDDALHDLDEADRAALVLRFLEDRSLRDVGARLGLQENAARMRVERALEKLRGLLARRGITSTAAGLTAALAVGVATPAPAALAVTITSAALAGGAAAGSTTLTLMKLMSLTKLKVGLIGAMVVAGIALPAWQQARLQRAEAENAQLRAQGMEAQPQDAELSTLRGEVDRLSKVEADQAELQRLRQWQAQTEPELLRLRGMAGVARRANVEAEQLRAQLTRQSSDAASNPIPGAMADAMKHAMEQQVEGQLARMTASLHLTPEQAQAVRDILSRKAQVMSAGMQQAFSGKFDKVELTRLAKEGGDPDAQIKALLAPEQKADYKNYQQEENAHTARQAANSELVQLDSSLSLTPDQMDRAFAALYEVSFNQLTGAAKPSTTNQAEAMQWALDQKARALEPVLTPTQMDTYRKQLAIQSKLTRDILSKMDATGAAGGPN